MRVTWSARASLLARCDLANPRGSIQAFRTAGESYAADSQDGDRERAHGRE